MIHFISVITKTIMFKLMIAAVTNAIDVNRSLSIWLSLKECPPEGGLWVVGL